MSNRPHLTLVAREDVPVVDSGAFIGIAPFAVTLGAPVLFGAGERRVLARSITPTAELLDLHAAVHRVAGDGDDAPFTAPDEWSPHVTLARRLRTSDIAKALDLVGGEIHGRTVNLRRWDANTSTITDIHTFPERTPDADIS